MTEMTVAANVVASLIVGQRTTTEMIDATTPVRRVVTPIEGRIAPDLKLVDLMIDVVTRNRSKAVATTPARRAATQIAGRTVPVPNLVDLMTDAATHNHTKTDAAGSVRRLVVRKETSFNSSMAPVTIVADSFRLTVAVASFRHIAAVTTVDTPTSVRRSVGQVMTVAE